MPDDYIESLREDYPPQLIEAYLNGEFVNLTSGAVYPDFSRELNHSPTILLPNEALHVGLDFNVNNMAAIGFVIRDEAPHAVNELVKVRDTPTMAAMINERYKSQGHAVTVYPDASGQNTSSKGASVSDLTILQKRGLYDPHRHSESTRERSCEQRQRPSAELEWHAPAARQY
ncbi:hypothetical protein ACFS07_13320 [Undibacterium arcticum]